jgi:hypothetical protein
MEWSDQRSFPYDMAPETTIAVLARSSILRKLKRWFVLEQ